VLSLNAIFYTLTRKFPVVKCLPAHLFYNEQILNAFRLIFTFGRFLINYLSRKIVSINVQQELFDLHESCSWLFHDAVDFEKLDLFRKG